MNLYRQRYLYRKITVEGHFTQKIKNRAKYHPITLLEKGEDLQKLIKKSLGILFICSFFHLPLVRLLYSHMLPDKDIKNIGYFTELLPIYREILKNLLIKYFFSKSLPSSCLYQEDLSNYSCCLISDSNSYKKVKFSLPGTFVPYFQTRNL